MADVFISYSRQDRALAEALAARLEGEGRTVWWDTNLLGGDQFRQVIVEQLNAAKSVVVIWTPNSVKSEWVISEATRAAAQKKFVPVKSADLALTDIPPPFDTYHTVDLQARRLGHGMQIIPNEPWVPATAKLVAKKPIASRARGWRRIGILVSAIWFVLFVGYVWTSETSRIGNFYESQLAFCNVIYDNATTYLLPKPFDTDEIQKQKEQKRLIAEETKTNCEKRGSNLLLDQQGELRSNTYWIILADLASVLLGWIIVWCGLSIARWAAKGFIGQ